MFSFTASESILGEFPNTRYTYVDVEEKKVCKVNTCDEVSYHVYTYTRMKRSVPSLRGLFRGIYIACCLVCFVGWLVGWLVACFVCVCDCLFSISVDSFFFAAVGCELLILLFAHLLASFWL